jgi:ribonuclease HI
MNPGMPHLLLFAETSAGSGNGSSRKGNRPILLDKPEGDLAPNTESFSGAWRFIVWSIEGEKQFEAADVEAEVFGERLDLLTLVRALESLDQPSRVSLIGCSNYIRQGIQFGMSEWRANDWLWEWFGQMVPVKNADLWRRLDRLMAFHQVECQLRRIDVAHAEATKPNYLAPRGNSANRLPLVIRSWTAKAWNRLPATVRQSMVEMERKLRDCISVLGGYCLPRRTLEMR